MALKYSKEFIFEAILVILITGGGFTIPVSAATPTTSYFIGFSGFIDYGYSTTIPSVVISPSYSNIAFQEYDIKYGYSIPGKTNNGQHNLPGTSGSFDNLFAKAMVNYHVNPPKPIANPSPDFTFHNLNTVHISFT
jgi:hypothetical protein